MILRKLCRQCRRAVYSLSESGAWICPHCGNDLSLAPLEKLDRSMADIVPLSLSPPEVHQLN